MAYSSLTPDLFRLVVAQESGSLYISDYMMVI